MKRSVVRRILFPLVAGTVLATFGGWWFFETFVAPVVSKTAKKILRDGEHKGVEARVNYYTVSLRGNVSSPTAREAAQAALNPARGWGLRARTADNRVKVPPSLTMVEVSASGLRAIGWVKDETEREALLDLALRQGGFERDQVDVSEVQVYPYVTPTGAGSISLSTPATAREVSGMAWLRGFWESLPKVPRLEGTPEGRNLRLRGRVATEADRKDVTKWVSSIRPDLKVDGSRIDLDPQTRPISLPAPQSAPAPDSWLEPLASSLTARPSLRFRAPTETASASLSGLIPASENWSAILNPENYGGDLKISPVVLPNPDEDLSAVTLASLIKVVSSLHEGMMEYAPTGLSIQGEGDAKQLDALRAIDLEPLLPELTKIEVKMPEPGRLSGVLDGSNLLLRGTAPDEATRDALVAWIRFVRPDLAVDATRLAVDPAVVRWTAPVIPTTPGPSFNDVEVSHPWLRKLVEVLRTGPSLHFKAGDGTEPPTFSWFGPSDLTWASTLAAAAAAGGQSNLSALHPGGRTSPLISDASAPAPTILGQLIGAVASLPEGELIYHPDTGLTIRGLATPAQEQVILTIGTGRMDPARVHIELRPPPVDSDAPRNASTLGGLWSEGSLSFYGTVPDTESKELILAALRESGRRIRVDASAIEVREGARFPAPSLAAELATRLVSAPGTRRFIFGETSLTVSGEVTHALLREWKPVFDKLAQGGFGESPRWEMYPSIYHFPSYRRGPGLPEQARDQLSALLATNEILFEAGSATLGGQEGAKLNAISKALKELTVPVKIVAGAHGEAQGDSAQNAALNRRRAEAVVEELTKLGAGSAQFLIEEFGPVPTADGTGKALKPSRRVELLLQ
jgi:hypothetical protein